PPDGISTRRSLRSSATRPCCSCLVCEASAGHSGAPEANPESRLSRQGWIPGSGSAGPGMTPCGLRPLHQLETGRALELALRLAAAVRIEARLAGLAQVAGRECRGGRCVDRLAAILL